jgi:hypothetical protein
MRYLALVFGLRLQQVKPLGRSVATPAEARKILDLRPR